MILVGAVLILQTRVEMLSPARFADSPEAGEVRLQ
jgi:hypothetical protein